MLASTTIATALALATEAPRTLLAPGAGLRPGSVLDLKTAGPAGGGANDINQWGQITGSTDTPEGWPRAFTAWPRGSVTLLGTLANVYSFGEGINDYGDVVGESGAPNFGSHAFRQSGARIYDLGPLFAVDINNRRYTAGWTGTQAAIWSPTGAVRLLLTPTMPDGDESGNWWSGAMGGINNRGQAAGFYTDVVTGIPYAARWEPDGRITDLGTGTAMAINEAGDVAGWGFGVSGFLWRAGTRIDLPEIAPLGMNDAGQLVGICGNGTPDYDACVWSEATGVVRLAKPVAGYARAEAINDLGEVVGTLGERGGPGHPLWWYAPADVAVQLATIRRLLGLLEQDDVLGAGHMRALTAMLQKTERTWRSGDGARAAASLRQMARLLRSGAGAGSGRDRTIHVEALLDRLAITLNGGSGGPRVPQALVLS